MSDVLLIHGSGHGAWCWERLIPQLEARGHRARAIDLPGHGADTTPLAQVTLERYAEAIDAALPAGRRTVLLGHSMAGFPITAAAERAAERIARLVYLCAYLPEASGASLAELRRRSEAQPLVPAIRMAPDRGSFTVDPALAPGIFYTGCDAQTAAWATARLGPQALAPQTAPLAPGPRALALPRDYILCRRDGTIPPQLQAAMAAALPPGRVHEGPWDHSPFLSDPAGLADLLTRIVAGGPDAG